MPESELDSLECVQEAKQSWHHARREAGKQRVRTAGEDDLKRQNEIQLPFYSLSQRHLPS